MSLAATPASAITPRFEISFSRAAHAGPITGRLVLFLSKTNQAEPRLLLQPRGPAIFRQVRCGLNGRRFVFYKFRSMCEKAEEMQADIAHLNERDGVVFKIPQDPRLTAVGRYLRKFSIDEWPQLWNVLRGEMSFVGPRPERAVFVEQLERVIPGYINRLAIRPGITGLSASWRVWSGIPVPALSTSLKTRVRCWTVTALMPAHSPWAPGISQASRAHSQRRGHARHTALVWSSVAAIHRSGS